MRKLRLRLYQIVFFAFLYFYNHKMQLSHAALSFLNANEHAVSINTFQANKNLHRVRYYE